jgi:hypothetical protein
MRILICLFCASYFTLLSQEHESVTLSPGSPALISLCPPRDRDFAMVTISTDKQLQKMQIVDYLGRYYADN